jgi:predicted ArsR family transcriptional regulator
VVFIGEPAQREAKDGEHVSPLESRTRSRVLHMVSADGPISAAELGRHLDLTPAAVRRHLDALVEQGAVVPHEPTGGRRGRGRPARAYVVSDAGHSALEADYDSLAVEVLRYLEAHAGPAAVGDFARSRVGALEERYAARLAAAGDDPAARTAALVEALSEDGFAATARPVGAGALTGVQLCQGHCPVQHVATEFPAFCEAETDAFSRLLGVHVQRLATLAGGHHVCTTFVPTGGITTRTRKTPAAAGVVADDDQTQITPVPTAGTRTTARTDTLTHVKEGSS